MENKCCWIEMIEADDKKKEDIIWGCCSCSVEGPCWFCVTEVYFCSKCGKYTEETF